MSLLSGFLTSKQLRIWDLFRSGVRQATIAKQLKISRQATSLTLNQSHLKMNRALLAAAKLHNLQINTLDEKHGFVTGYSPQARTRLTIIYTLRHGLQTWFHHDEGDCIDCPEFRTCIETLKEEALRRGIHLSDNELDQQPGHLAEIIFNHIKNMIQAEGEVSL